MVLNLILCIIAICYLFYKFISEKPCPKGYRYDSKKEDDDIKAGVSIEERQKKKKRGEYWTSREELNARKPEEVIPGVVDIKRYENDKRKLGEKYTELCRQGGAYKFISDC